MVRKKKPFIDKKHATTYKLVHRSQHDPLVADQDANQMVLKELPGEFGYPERRFLFTLLDIER